MKPRPEFSLTPTDPGCRVDTELERWSRIYAGEEYFSGEEPGPIARRTVRYHRVYQPTGGTALDAGCGEGQDLAFLAQRGYRATGVEFTPAGVAKTRRFLAARGLQAEVVQEDLRDYRPEPGFDLVMCANTLQFLGPDAPACLERLMAAVNPGGVIGISLFAREPHEPELRGTVHFVVFEELLDRFRGWQCLEAAKLWQWNTATNVPQQFATVIARRR
jgi:trans-aconitate methyltransferase